MAKGQLFLVIRVNHFILTSNPHLKETYRVAEVVLPLLEQTIKGNHKIKLIVAGEV